tara:strand:+ start:93 stop:947 length:855 start_codon:yes stop_codon:yes gene_type:complete
MSLFKMMQAISSSGSSASVKKKIIIDIGQSNSAGYAETARMPEAGYLLNPSGVSIYDKPDVSATDNGNWVSYTAGQYQQVYPVDRQGTYSQFGATVVLGQLAQSFFNENIYLIKCGFGGTSLQQNVNQFTDWNANSTNENLDFFLENFFDVAIPKLGDVEIIGVIWHQGEADATNGTATTNYGTNLTAMINKVRAHDSLLSSCPIVLTELNYAQTANESTINGHIQTVATAMANVNSISISDLPRKKDLTTLQKKGFSAGLQDDSHSSYLAQIGKAERAFEFFK